MWSKFVAEGATSHTTASQNSVTSSKETKLPKPNYQFEKRKRDNEKKAKKEEKRLRKLNNVAPSSPEEPAK
jgi:hypothetical protein